MEITSYEEIWRRIPPEEKIELLARAHAKGILTAVSAIVLCGTLAIAFQAVWLFWTAIISSPLIFQATAGKAFRACKPVAMLEYLAARAAARRYAFVVKAQNLSVDILFRAELERLGEAADVVDLYGTPRRTDTKRDVWVSLFGDAVIILSERKGGAELQFGHLINDRLSISSNADELGTDYSNQKELILQYEDRIFGLKRVRITSRHPAALIVFEKRLRQVIDTNAATTSFLNQLGVDEAAIGAMAD